jgi:hypothetical protein
MKNIEYSTLRLSKSEQNVCPSCNSQTFTLGSGTPTHYASLRCADCERFIRWLPRPENHETHNDENALIDRLLNCDRLNPWELTFCQSLKTQRKRSPKQRAKLQAIASKLGGTR